MEEEPKFLVDEGNGGDDEVYEDELFYENIEAPKFVDLAAPDRYQPVNDRYWFCSRVGCDQKHEEEMNSEEIYKRFVLRVMAARSPNVRLRKALYRKDSSSNLKCPKTVPPKPRMSRLALISSISKRLVGSPNSKSKQSSMVSKALTTPRNKKQLSNLDTFRSVRNPKGMSIAVTSNKVVAKALVFASPRKAGKGKTMEQKTPVKDLCTAIKKLEIGSGKKPVLGCNRPPLSDAKRKLLRVREVKSRVYDGLSLHQRVTSDSSVNEIVKKSDDDDQGSANLEGPSENAVGEASLLDSSRSGSNNSATSQDSKADDNSTVRGGGAEDIEASSLEKESNHDTEKDDSDDKENESTSGNKNSNIENKALGNIENESTSGNKNSNIENKALGKLHGRKENPKVQSAKRRGTLPKKTSATTAIIPEELKQRKPKPTNPKPFRLRTDERRILKEAILEKKLPEKKTTSAQTKLLQDGASHLQVLREKVGRTLSTTPQRHTVSSQQKLQAPKLGNSSRNGRSQAVKRSAKPRMAKADTEEPPSMAIPYQLGVIRENSQTISRPLLGQVASPCIGSKPLLKSKSHRINNSRETNFHPMHTPKSCTRKLA